MPVDVEGPSNIVLNNDASWLVKPLQTEDSGGSTKLQKAIVDLAMVRQKADVKESRGCAVLIVHAGCTGIFVGERERGGAGGGGSFKSGGVGRALTEVSVVDFEFLQTDRS